MTQVVNHKGKRLKVGPRGGGLPYIYIYIYTHIPVYKYVCIYIYMYRESFTKNQ